MLGGQLIIKDAELGEVAYSVKARDSFNDLKLYIVAECNGGTAAWTNRQNLFDYQLDDNGLRYNPYASISCDERRLDIKKTNKYKSNITNRDFCVKVAGLVRYMQIAGKQQYNQQGLDNQFSATRQVKITEPNTGKLIGEIGYNMGLITYISCENKYVRLVLKEESDAYLDQSLFKELKEKDKFGRVMSPVPIAIVGFKLSSEVLGFEYVPEVEKETVQAFGMYETIEEVIANNPDKNTSWILDRNYVIVTDDILDEVFDMFMKHEGLIAFDTETSGLKINFKSRTNEAHQLVGCVLSRQTGEGYYFPLQHKLFKNLCDGDHFYFMDRYMRPILENKKIVCHNVKFDWKVAHIYDINVNCVYDTMLALGVTKRYEEETYELGLKALTKNIFGLDALELSDFVMGGSFGDSEIAFWDLPYELVRQYAPADTDMTLSLYEFIEKEDIINKYDAKKVFDMELTFAKAVAYSEFYGYHINVDKIPELQAKIEGAMDSCKKKMFELAGKEFNANSPTQLVPIIYDELYPELRKELGDKKASTDKETLKTLAGKTDVEGNPKYPFVKILKEYRDNEGIYKNFLKKLHEFATPDGYIFPDVLQLGTNTGRSSVKNPNYQSYNDTVKKYTVPRPDFIHVDCDFSQIEYRVLCSMAQQEQLIEAFNDPDLDYHSYQASRMFNVPYAAVSKALRQQSKGINFGLPYGMGDESLGARIFGERNKENTLKAAALRQKFFQGQEKIQAFFDNARAGGVKNGYTSTQFGRRRYYHRGVFSVNEIRRQAGNHVIQGTAADVYKLAVCGMFNRVCKEGWLGKVLFNAFVHDEILMEVHKSINPYYFTKAWREEFELKIEGYCRLYAGLGFGFCWYDAKKQDLPPQFIDELIAKYQEDMDWDEDLEKLLKDMKADYAAHNTRRIKEFIFDPKNQGTVIKPVIGSLMTDEIGIIVGKLQKGDPAELATVVAATGINIPAEGEAKIKNLQDQLKVYCKFYGLDYSQVDIKAPEDVVVEQKEEKRTVIFGEEEEEDTFEEINPEEVRKLTLTVSGYCVDYATKTLHLAEMFYRTTKGFEQATKILIEKGVITDEGEYRIIYYPSMKGDNPQSALIPNFRLTQDGLQTLIRYYTAWKSAGIGVIN